MLFENTIVIFAGWFASRWFATVVVLALSPVLLAAVSLVRQRPKLPRNAPKVVPEWPLLGSIAFYYRRQEFLHREQKRSGGRPFSFHYGKYPIVSLLGEAGRTLLLTSRQLDLRAGYSALLAASPHIEADLDDPTQSQVNLFKKILTRKRLVDSLPSILKDSYSALGGLSRSESAVPVFSLVYRLIYRLTHRTGGVHEIAESDALLDSTLKNFSSVENCSPLQIMLPRWPLPSMLSKIWGGYRLHRVIAGVMHDRRRHGRVERDALQLLMGLGETDLGIVQCIIGILFSGLLNTGVMSAWLLCHLAENGDWYRKVQDEVDTFVAKNRKSADESVLEILQRIPYSDWDTQLPVVGVCLRETLRLNLFGPMLRKNLSDEDLVIPGTNLVVPKKAFAFYTVDDVHLDEMIYPSPFQWEPARHLPGRDEGADVPHAFLGWGSGLHPCLGLKKQLDYEFAE
ncbi:cytochrome P450 6A1 [Cordyceps fumosorosea ARSEF 2679]|uniref:Cytochrome P450 6A1 n=1 Tax=Cordyceps fumosorosea (strain ARSEF 2679) TaxID=1081104 RepID=A0A168ASJ9_CORFA|nr:cytochrome P450 6A1 [Cordyceps fumosorosea ARSEF 2679]OAA69136.1 cytochrome P450 6A1 [Cordyceps fumosorosea ARSEF 2679]